MNMFRVHCKWEFTNDIENRSSWHKKSSQDTLFSSAILYPIFHGRVMHSIGQIQDALQVQLLTQYWKHIFLRLVHPLNINDKHTNPQICLIVLLDVPGLFKRMSSLNHFHLTNWSFLLYAPSIHKNLHGHHYQRSCIFPTLILFESLNYWGGGTERERKKGVRNRERKRERDLLSVDSSPDAHGGQRRVGLKLRIRSFVRISHTHLHCVNPLRSTMAYVSDMST